MNCLGKPSALWTACDIGNIELVESLLAIEDMCEDITAPDGTSAAAIALGHKNAEICVTLLESGIEPRDNIVFLARELLKVEDDDRQTEKLKESVKKSLRRMKLLAKETSDTDESNSKGAQKRRIFYTSTIYSYLNKFLCLPFKFSEDAVTSHKLISFSSLLSSSLF